MMKISSSNYQPTYPHSTPIEEKLTEWSHRICRSVTEYIVFAEELKNDGYTYAAYFLLKIREITEREREKQPDLITSLYSMMISKIERSVSSELNDCLEELFTLKGEEFRVAVLVCPHLVQNMLHSLTNAACYEMIFNEESPCIRLALEYNRLFIPQEVDEVLKKNVRKLFDENYSLHKSFQSMMIDGFVNEVRMVKGLRDSFYFEVDNSGHEGGFYQHFQSTMIDIQNLPPSSRYVAASLCLKILICFELSPEYQSRMGRIVLELDPEMSSRVKK